MSQLSVRERNLAALPVLTLEGELNINTAADLRRSLIVHLKGKKPRLLVDLGGLKMMDTSGLATLIEAHIKAEKRGGRLVLFGLNEPMAGIFRVMHVDRLFCIAASEQEAQSLLEGGGD